MERYLNNYLKETTSDPLVKKYLDFFKVELDWHIYNYGNHFQARYLREYEKPILYRLFQYCKELTSLMSKKIQDVNRTKVLSSVVLPQSSIDDLNLYMISSVFQPVGRKNILGDSKSLKLFHKVSNTIKKGTFNDLINKDFFNYLEETQNAIINLYKEIDLKGLFLYTDQYFFSKYLIDIFKKLERPSFIFSHGLPGIYTKDVDNRSDYLLVWGEKIKDNYVNLAGMSSDKIKVVGNIKYPKVSKNRTLRNSLENILVIPCSSNLWHQHTWGEPVLMDRSMVILYLYQVQNVLEKFGVRHARFRPHPSINRHWVKGFIDNDFYLDDDLSLEDSLYKSSLVIGATSSTFIEGLMAGVNFLLYEPKDINGLGLCRTKRVPPFDGSELNLEIATSELELEHMIRDRYMTPIDILNGYIQPLDLGMLKTLIK